jgi:hypothetical protein
MKIKGIFMKIVVFNEIVTCVLCSNQKSKFKHVIIQFGLHNIHIVGENTLKGTKIVVTLFYFLGVPCLNFNHVIIMKDFHKIFTFYSRSKPK